MPTINSTNPVNGATDIPIGLSFVIDFDKGVDLSTARNSIILTGPDYDQMSGSGNSVYINNDKNTNPFFLSSPGFTGVMDLDIRAFYYDLNTGDIVAPAIAAPADEVSEGVGHRLIVSPKIQLAPHSAYRLYLLGDPDEVGNGISSRTVYDVVADGDNSTTAEVHTHGGYEGTIADVLNIEVTESGNIGVAKYRWWFTSGGLGSAKTNVPTTRKFRFLDQGVQIRFGGNTFVAGDTYTVVLQPPDRMSTSTTINFTTNDGTFSEAPEGQSISAPAQPPAGAILPGWMSSDELYLQVLEMIPEDRVHNVSVDNRTITIVFSEALDENTITNQTVKLWQHDISGHYNFTQAPKELVKILSVAGNTLTIEF